MKNAFKNFILGQLQAAVKRFFGRNPNVKLIAVVGSVGKTSTKLAIVKVLSARYRVLAQHGNHNSELSVPLAILDLPLPDNIYSPIAWLKTVHWARVRAKQQFNYNVIVVELGTDAPGDIAKFGTYLRPHLSVITAISAEHMEFFKTLDAVAKEELAIGDFSAQILVNRDDVNEDYAAMVRNPMISTYGLGGVAEYHFLTEQSSPNGTYSGKFVSPEYGEQPVALNVVGEHSLKPLIGAASVGIKFGLQPAEIAKQLTLITPVPGRMQILRGIKNSLIIDDTYNSSPIAAAAALQTLYSMQERQHIAILGSMNELGAESAKEHAALGNLCDNSLLEWVVTIGKDAEQYLAPAAINRGCQVRSFSSPYEAGGFVRSILESNTVILVKGSQTGIYAEEAIKLLLADAADETKLVRQTPEWQQKKEAYFDKFNLGNDAAKKQALENA